MPQLHVGLDLDNTVISYETGFAEVAVELGLLPAGHGLHSKGALKSFLWGLPDGERVWMRLQGQVYGRYIGRGRLFDGVRVFLLAMRAAGAKVSIVSHKTQYGHFDEAKVDLWEAALGWLERQGLLTDRYGLDRASVYMRESRDEKIAAIAALGCDAFIDDLPEVLHHPRFPRQTAAIWFAGGQELRVGKGLVPHRDWSSILDAVDRLLPPPSR